MAVPIISRDQWGATPWRGSTPHRVNLSERTEFFVHYYGAPMPKGMQTGVRCPRAVEQIHLANGWSGTGYNFMVDMAGAAFEGRGWNKVGAHCPNHNRQGIGVFVAVGGDQQPSTAALRTVRALYEEANYLTGRALAKKGHRDGKSTACPGEILYSWVHNGMVVPGFTEPAVRAIGDGQDSDRPVLAIGARGRHVEALQLALQRVGYVNLKVDGDFGQATQKTVVDFQAKNGLKPDGVAGQATYAKLSQLIPDDNPLTIPNDPEEDDMRAQLINLTGTRRFFLATATKTWEVGHAELQAHRAAGLVVEPGKALTADELRLLKVPVGDV